MGDSWKDLLIKNRKTMDNPDGYPVPESLSSQWEAIADYCFMDRDDISKFDSSLSALEYYVDLGLYPPPELLLTIIQQYTLYLYSDLDLEDIFFGKPKQKTGNLSKRFRRDMLYGFFHMFILKGVREGKTKIKIAEEFIQENSLDIDPESLLRRYRDDRKKRVNKTDN